MLIGDRAVGRGSVLPMWWTRYNTYTIDGRMDWVTGLFWP